VGERLSKLDIQVHPLDLPESRCSHQFYEFCQRVCDPCLLEFEYSHNCRAFDRIQVKYPDWQLTILGEGSMRSELEQLRSQLQLTDRVHLPGLVTNVQEYLHQAALFVMPSRFEGFPMALCEVMACGLPTIAADCLSAPRESVEDGVNGLLVATEDVDALAAGFDALMSDPAKRQQLAQNALQILDRFGVEHVIAIWAEAIDRVMAWKRR